MDVSKALYSAALAAALSLSPALANTTYAQDAAQADNSEIASKARTRIDSLLKQGRHGRAAAVYLAFKKAYGQDWDDLDQKFSSTFNNGNGANATRIFVDHIQNFTSSASAHIQIKTGLEEMLLNSGYQVLENPASGIALKIAGSINQYSIDVRDFYKNPEYQKLQAELQATLAQYGFSQSLAQSGRHEVVSGVGKGVASGVLSSLVGGGDWLKAAISAGGASIISGAIQQHMAGNQDALQKIREVEEKLGQLSGKKVGILVASYRIVDGKGVLVDTKTLKASKEEVGSAFEIKSDDEMQKELIDDLAAKFNQVVAAKVGMAAGKRYDPLLNQAVSIKQSQPDKALDLAFQYVLSTGRTDNAEAALQLINEQTGAELSLDDVLVLR